MPLPDIARLELLPASAWRAFGERLLSIGFDDTYLAPFDRIAPEVRGSPRDVILAWHLRQRSEPAAWALRMFVVGDPVTEAEAAAVLGGDLLDQLTRVGFIARREAGVSSAFFVMRLAGFFLAFDELSAGEDAAMGFGTTTIELLRAAQGTRRFAAALDLGCGAGACALTISRDADRVVATDINPRAVALARINAAINGVGNVEFRVGDLFAPVAGERFDLVLSQPPFVARPDGVEERVYLYGGTRGDELGLRLLGEVLAHLTPAGRAIVLVEFPEIDGSRIEDRVRAAMPAGDACVLLLQSDQSVDGDCISYAMAQHPKLGPAFEAAVVARRAHLAKLGVSGMKLSFTVVEHAGAGPGWIAAAPVRFRDHRNGLSPELVDGVFGAHRVAFAADGALLDATLRVPDGVSFVEGTGSSDGELTARYRRDLLYDDASVNRDAFELAVSIHGAPTVRAGVTRLAAERGLVLPGALDEILPGVRALLRHRLLETQ